MSRCPRQSANDGRQYKQYAWLGSWWLGWIDLAWSIDRYNESTCYPLLSCGMVRQYVALRIRVVQKLERAAFCANGGTWNCFERSSYICWWFDWQERLCVSSRSVEGLCRTWGTGQGVQPWSAMRYHKNVLSMRQRDYYLHATINARSSCEESAGANAELVVSVAYFGG